MCEKWVSQFTRPCLTHAITFTDHGSHTCTYTLPMHKSLHEYRYQVTWECFHAILTQFSASSPYITLLSPSLTPSLSPYLRLSLSPTIAFSIGIFQENPSQGTTRGPFDQISVHLSLVVMLVILTTTLTIHLRRCLSPPTPATLLSLFSHQNLPQTIYPDLILIDLRHGWLQSDKWIKSSKFRSVVAWFVQNTSTAAQTVGQTARVLLDMWQNCQYFTVQWLSSLFVDMYCTEYMSRQCSPWLWYFSLTQTSLIEMHGSQQWRSRLPSFESQYVSHGPLLEPWKIGGSVRLGDWERRVKTCVLSVVLSVSVVEMVVVVGDLESDLSQMQSSFTHSWGMMKDEISPIYIGICEELMEISCKNQESGGNFTVGVRRVTQRSTCQVWSNFCLDEWGIAECRQMSTFCEPPSGWLFAFWSRSATNGENTGEFCVFIGSRYFIQLNFVGIFK